MQTIDQLIRQRAGDHRAGLLFADRTWTHDQVVRAQADRAAVLASLRRPGPFHVALLLDNVPEYVFWMGAAALAGAVLVGGNPTHRGDELARDLSHTECQLLVTDGRYLPLVDGYDLGTGPAAGADPGHRRPLRRPVVTGDPATGALVGAATGAPLPDPARHGGHRGDRSASCCSPRAPRAHPRPACAARGGWPASAASWPRCSS